MTSSYAFDKIWIIILFEKIKNSRSVYIFWGLEIFKKIYTKFSLNENLF